jgi:hypothetical protein
MPWSEGKGDRRAGQIMVPRPAPFSKPLKGKSDRWIGSVIAQDSPAVGPESKYVRRLR